MTEKKYPNQMAQKKKNHRVRKTRLFQKLLKTKKWTPKNQKKRILTLNWLRSTDCREKLNI